jgi:ankyrin repeat protein
MKLLIVLTGIFVLFVNLSKAQIIVRESLPCDSKGNIEKVKELLAAGVKVDSTYDTCITLEPSPRGITLLMTAASSGDLELVRLLLENGADVNAIDTWGLTPLSYAISYQKIEIVRLLIEQGANVNVRGENDTTPLMKASATGNIEVIELMLNKGADNKAKDKNKVTALMYAAADKQLDAMKFLISRGADPKAKDKDGRTAKTYLKKGFPREYIIYKL